MQLRVRFDFQQRIVTLAMGSPLGDKVSVMEVPFAIWKAAAAEILRTEVEDELTVSSTPAVEPKKIELVE